MKSTSPWNVDALETVAGGAGSGLGADVTPVRVMMPSSIVSVTALWTRTPATLFSVWTGVPLLIVSTAPFTPVIVNWVLFSAVPEMKIVPLERLVPFQLFTSLRVIVLTSGVFCVAAVWVNVRFAVMRVRVTELPVLTVIVEPLTLTIV